MCAKIIAIENREGPYHAIFQRILRMVPERDKDNTNLQRLLAFRLKADGEAATIEFLMGGIKDFIQCGYRGSFYDFLTVESRKARVRHPEPDSPEPA